MLDKPGTIKQVLLLLSLLLLFTDILGSSSDTTIINSYTQIKAVFSENDMDPDSLVVADPSEFQEGNTVLIYQAKGMSWNYEFNSYDVSGFAGRFEFHFIYKIKGDTIILPSSLNREANGKYQPNDMMQMVKVPSLSKYVATSTLSATPWDGYKGGILAIVSDTLELQANIDVTGKGFRGADPGNEKYEGSCSQSDSVNYSKGYYTKNDKDSAGLKGESVVLSEDNYRRGSMCIGNGGGGGNGRHSGGGGGSNMGVGGSGGTEAKPCSTNASVQGVGGVNFNGTIFFGETRAAFGGGGGCGTQEFPFKASKGGNGGGIVMIIANVVVGNNFSIIANGQSVNDTCTAGAGGGGGGGSIVFDVNKVNGLLTLQARGGRGGSTKGLISADNGGGAGGGGGGGLVFHNGENPMATADLQRGTRGSSYKPDASSGLPGDIRNKLLMPIKDFLFNVMPANQEICAGEIPKLFEASKPKGGNGSYTYKWFRSNDLVTWDTVGNTCNFQESALFDTTYYKRIVISYAPNGDTIIDKGTILTVKVPPAIKNNAITSDGIYALCEGTTFPQIRGTSTVVSFGSGVVTGGNGNFKYLWQDSLGSWTNVPGKNDTVNYQPVQTDTIHLRRVVKSGVCTSYSNVVTINVLANISGNVVSDTQWISLGYKPKKLIQAQPGLGGGDVGNYSYKWSQSLDKNIWSDAANINVNSDYNITLPNNNPDTFYYRRSVFSGQNNTCSSQSNIISIYVLDSIHKNIIYGSDTICGLTSPITDFFDKQKVTGGDGIYSYQWEKSEDNANWDSLTVITNKSSYNPGSLINTTFFRRIVLSGNRYACKDTSNSIKITVKPYIKNNFVVWPKNDTIICYNQKPDSVIMHQPADGDGPYIYTWQVSTDKNSWATAQGITYNSDYQSDNLTNSIYLRRKIESGVCLSYSDTLQITVLPLITNNYITSDNYVCKYSAPSLLVGSGPQNGDNSYKYKWFRSVDNSNWIAAPGNDSTISYQPDTTSKKLYFKRLVMSGLANCCKDTSPVFDIQIHELPTGTLKSFNDSICLGSSYQLEFSLTGKPDYHLLYSNGARETGAADYPNNIYITNITPDTAGIYNFRITSLSDGNGCVAKEIPGIGKLAVFTIPKSFAGNDTAVCGLTVNLKAIPSVGTGLWSSKVETQFSSGQNAANQNITIADYGKYYFTWKEDNGGCIDKDSVGIIFYFQPVSANAGEDKKGSYLFRTILNAEPALAGTGIGTWSSPDVTIAFDNDTVPNTYADNLKFGDNILVWTRTNGVCNAITDTIIITTGDIRVPNGFSPNNDKVNDKFEIIGLDQVKDADLVILNKWGLKVYESKDYKNDWDGTYKGTNLPEDTYFYILNVIGKTYKGFVTIRR